MTPSRGRRIACAYCGLATELAARFCPACGQPFPNLMGSVCPHCGATCLPGTAFCEACGADRPPQPYLIVTGTGLRLNLFAGDRTITVLGRADALSGVTPDLDLEPYVGELAGLS